MKEEKELVFSTLKRALVRSYYTKQTLTHSSSFLNKLFLIRLFSVF
ncbi:hypothetical protein [Streptococcus saliviloxodontae]|uniref:Uncharacterized protein n=1 Tax=Streptococcus saliviloxodontae TaxID=1349416 RepID=A0ABS2PNE6_9STRE|nr:hypothetical protein [Streptococcus saliviloxodontae]MBM7636807.1 hypothetical protein [Streptococcus saliviloxodontae]